MMLSESLFGAHLSNSVCLSRTIDMARQLISLVKAHFVTGPLSSVPRISPIHGKEDRLKTECHAWPGSYSAVIWSIQLAYSKRTGAPSNFHLNNSIKSRGKEECVCSICGRARCCLCCPHYVRLYRNHTELIWTRSHVHTCIHNGAFENKGYSLVLGHPTSVLHVVTLKIKLVFFLTPWKRENFLPFFRVFFVLLHQETPKDNIRKERPCCLKWLWWNPLCFVSLLIRFWVRPRLTFCIQA